MISIDESVINQMIEKQLQKQISSKLDKYFNSTEFKDMVKLEVQNILYKWNNVNAIADNFMKSEGVKQSIILRVADVVYGNIVNTIKNVNDEDY